MRQLGLAARAVRGLLTVNYRRQGWTAVGDIPSPRKFVLIAAPHTSNWDFPNFLGLTQALGLDAHFMGKDSLFRWPMTGFMRDVGGIPVDRSSSHDMVQQMAAEFARRDEFVLTIAPEGTRGAVTRWRTGFYRIAQAAGVPIVCGFADYPRRIGGLGPVFRPTGDYDADMEPVFAFYRSITGKNPAKAGGLDGGSSGSAQRPRISATD